MVTKEYSSATKAENNPMEKFETILQAGNKCLITFIKAINLLNEQLKMPLKFASHDHLKKEVKMSSLDSLSFSCRTRSITKDEERDQRFKPFLK